jgi:hypothetical protein
MNRGEHRSPAEQALLTDVLSAPETPPFREALLAETLGLVRRRRRARQAWRAVRAVALVAGLGLLMWRSPSSRPVGPAKVSRPYTLVLSQSLAPAALVSTQPFAPSRIVISSRSVEVVQTASSRPKLHEMSDGELLALTRPKPAALVWLGPHSAELVFANPEDREDLVRN